MTAHTFNKRVAFILSALLAATVIWIVVAHAATVTSSSGKRASVSSAFAPHIQCFINKLDAVGYRIRFMTGYARRGNASAHPTGNAIDINQIGFGRVTTRFPSNYLSMASECGVYSGSHFGDYGHFEMPNKYGYVNVHFHYAGRVHYASHSHHHHRHYASRYAGYRQEASGWYSNQAHY